MYHVPNVVMSTKALTSFKIMVVSNVTNKVTLLGSVLLLKDNDQAYKVLWFVQLDLYILVLLDLLVFNLVANRVDVLEAEIQGVDLLLEVK